LRISEFEIEKGLVIVGEEEEIEKDIQSKRD
jgi:hypothetical protein